MNPTTQALNGKEPHPETILPERTQTARKYRAITKTALATRLGVSAQAITTYSPTNPRHITKANQNIDSGPKREIFL
jgi:hypothetical protein